MRMQRHHFTNVIAVFFDTALGCHGESANTVAMDLAPVRTCSWRKHRGPSSMDAEQWSDSGLVSDEV